MSSTSLESEIDTFALRKVMGSYLTGVTVVTTKDPSGRLWGLTVNSFTSLSLDPPLLLVCIGVSSGSYRAFRESDGFAVNILADDQRDISQAFASSSADKFKAVEWTNGKSGNPLVCGSAAWLECTAHRRVHEGDHMILIGRVAALGKSDRPPLGYHSGGYVSLLDRSPLRSNPSAR